MSKDRQLAKKKEKLKNDILGMFPNLEIFSGENCPEELLIKIKKTYRNYLIDLNLKKNKSSAELLFYEFLKHIKKNDINPCFVEFSEYNKILESDYVKNYFKKAVTNNTKKSELFYLCTQIVANYLVEILWNKLNFNNYFPNVFFTTGFINKNLFIKFFKLKTFKSEFGTTYKHFKDLNVDGKNYELHFTKHAFQRICERLLKVKVKENEDHTSVSNKAIMHGFTEFITHAHFEFCGFSSKNQHLLCCYLPVTFYADNILKLLGLNFNKLERLKNHQTNNFVLMKHFYFPFVVMDNKIVCKSTLLAGFIGTPENELRKKIISIDFEQKEIFDKDDTFDQIKNLFDDCYNHDDNHVCLFNYKFLKILNIYHLAGKSQFFKGDWQSIPYLAKISKELLAI